MSPDLINAAFQLFASAFILNHARVLWKSKQAHGVSMLSGAFFNAWGIWNVWYYPHLDQTLSFYAGVAVVLANTFWITLIWHLRRTEIK